MIALTCLLLVLAAPGDQLTGDWGGNRTALEDHGITLSVVYTSEVFVNFLGRAHGPTLLGHIDAAISLDTEKLGLWRGGRLFVLGQNNHGRGINEIVGSANTISNAEDIEFTQLSEFFFEQGWLDNRVFIRIGKQDASRDFALSPYGSDFINNNFGMFPTSPLPNYAANGLGAVLIVQPSSWLITRAAIFEGSPEIGSLGFDTAFKKDAGFTLIAGAAIVHALAAAQGTTSFSFWRQARSDFPENYNWGFFVQHDERIFFDPNDPEGDGGLVAQARFSWTMPDRNLVTIYASGAVTWKGIASRDADSVGVGFGYLGISEPLLGSAVAGSELHFELFYKMRVAPFLGLQPTVQFIRSPGGDGPDAFIAGLRFELVL